MTRALMLIAIAMPLAACVAPPQHLYSWGSYEQLIYANYASPGAGDAKNQVTSLERDYQAARGANRRLPPGWHAHLGYLYFQLGRADQAQQEFVTEKTQFPESAVFMDRLIAKLKKS